VPVITVSPASFYKAYDPSENLIKVPSVVLVTLVIVFLVTLEMKLETLATSAAAVSAPEVGA
jgi:hypothetical protein